MGDFEADLHADPASGSLGLCEESLLLTPLHIVKLEMYEAQLRGHMTGSWP